jgi:hypothetical protein
VPSLSEYLANKAAETNGVRPWGRTG